MIVFKFKPELKRDGQLIKRPVADVFLQSAQGKWIEFHPYIDSGADITLIPLSLGKLLDLSMDSHKIEQIGGIKGSVPVVYTSLNSRIGSYEININIGWCLIEDVPPLLGRADIFDFFDVHFRQEKGIIEFHTHEGE